MRQRRLNEVNADKGKARRGREETISKLMVEGEVNGPIRLPYEVLIGPNKHF